MERVKTAIFVFIISLLFFSPSKLFAQEAEVVGLQSITEYSEDIKEGKDNLLFIGDDCEACDELESTISEMNIYSFPVYLIDTAGDENFTKLLKSLYLSCSSSGIEPSVPFLYSADNCYIGKLSIVNRISSLAVENGSSIAEEGFDFLSAYKYQQDAAEYQNKSVVDIVFDQTNFWELIIAGVTAVVAVLFLVYLLINRKGVSKKQRMLYGVLQTLLFVLPTLYLGIKVNSAVDLSSQYSSAGSCQPDGSGCVSYAEREAARASDDDYRLAHPKQAAKAQAYLDSNGGAENAVANGNAQVVATSQALIDATRNSDNSINLDAARSLQKTLESGSVTAVSGQKVQVTTSSGTITLDASAAYATNPSAVYIAQVNLALASEGITCSRLEDCESALINKNSDTFKNKTTNPEALLYQFDKVTGQMITTAVGMSTVDDFCTITSSPTGGNSTGNVLCRCDNGLGGYVYTRTDEGNSCDAVCRVRNLVCEDCNPEPPGPPTNPPTSGPYCGDGILGNVSGEQCEYNDPSGVTCSWNSCDSSCKCPTENVSYCGDGKIDQGEQCELGDPSGMQCSWSTCNQVNCLCKEPGCGDGQLSGGEKCEKNDPTGVSCLWNNECNQLTCDCKVEQSPSCGDGVLQDNEQCELNDPIGNRCSWSVCSKYTCSCPVAPQTGVFTSYESKVILGATLLFIGLLFEYIVKLSNKTVMLTSVGISKLKIYIKENKKSKRIQKVSKRREGLEKRFK